MQPESIFLAALKGVIMGLGDRLLNPREADMWNHVSHTEKPHLADQLLIPLALAGGRFRTVRPTRHFTTNVEVIKRFLEVDIQLKEINEDIREVRVDL